MTQASLSCTLGDDIKNVSDNFTGLVHGSSVQTSLNLVGIKTKKHQKKKKRLCTRENSGAEYNLAQEKTSTYGRDTHRRDVYSQVKLHSTVQRNRRGTGKRRILNY